MLCLQAVPNPVELVKLSQCGGTAVDLLRMERLVLEKVAGAVRPVNHLSFLRLFTGKFRNFDLKIINFLKI